MNAIVQEKIKDLVLGDEIGRYFKHHQRNDLGSADVTRTYGTKY